MANDISEAKNRLLGSKAKAYVEAAGDGLQLVAAHGAMVFQMQLDAQALHALSKSIGTYVAKSEPFTEVAHRVELFSPSCLVEPVSAGIQIAVNSPGATPLLLIFPKQEVMNLISQLVGNVEHVIDADDGETTSSTSSPRKKLSRSRLRRRRQKEKGAADSDRTSSHRPTRQSRRRMKRFT